MPPTNHTEILESINELYSFATFALEKDILILNREERVEITDLIESLSISVGLLKGSVSTESYKTCKTTLGYISERILTHGVVYPDEKEFLTKLWDWVHGRTEYTGTVVTSQNVLSSNEH